MKIETILMALLKAKMLDKYWLSDSIKRDRQYRAFRDRILRMDAEKDARIAELEQEVVPPEWSWPYHDYYYLLKEKE